MRKKRKAFPRYPIPKSADLDSWVERWAKSEGGTYNDALYVWLRGRVGDILKSREDMEEVALRETRRIEKAAKCLEIGLGLIRGESEKEKIKKDLHKRTGLKF